MVDESKFWHLKKCPVFEHLSHEQMLALKASGELVDIWGMNKVVPSPPRDEPSIYLVKMGYVKLIYTDRSGEEATVLVLGPGDVFGSLEPEGRQEFGEHVRTITPACMLRVSRGRFERLLAEAPQVAYTLTKITMTRVHRMEVRLAEMMMHPAEARLAQALVELDEQVGRGLEDGGRELGLNLSHADLARLIGTSREFVSRILSNFRRRGWVRTAGRRLVLLDREALAATARQEAGNEKMRNEK